MRRFGLIGRSLKHSFSRNYFTQKFQDLQITDCSYELFELQSIDQFPALVKSLPDLAGLNATIPYKEEVIPFLDELHPDVQQMGACNCILVRAGRLIGYNTDYIGFRDSLVPKLTKPHQQALVLGSGGASKAVRYALESLGMAVQTVSRSAATGNLTYEQLSEEILEEHTLIVNTTPLGMYPEVDAAPAIPYQWVTNEHFLFDVVYNPAKTKFLALGEERGAQIANGEEMLVLQAEANWKIWNEA